MSWEPIETLIAISGYILASIGWLAFAREWKAHALTRDRLTFAQDRRRWWTLRAGTYQMKYAKLLAGNRDERGRFVKRERV